MKYPGQKHIKNKKSMSETKKQNQSQYSGEWLYFAPEHVTVRSIAKALDGTDAQDGGEEKRAYEVEIWEDAGVLEIIIGEGESVDIEQTQIHPKDEITAAFAREHDCKMVFLVTFKPENDACAKSVMKQILAAEGGLFCGDNEDFSPILE